MSLNRAAIAASALLAVTLAAARADSNGSASFPRLPEGTAITLPAIPSFSSRLFVPVLRSSLNYFRVDAAPIDQVLEAPAGFTVSIHRGGLAIVAPDGDAWGYARVRSGSRELTLTLMNLVPFETIENGRLGDYHIGEYAATPLRGLESYRRPAGFVRLTRENAETWVSDHYRLRDFQCKLDGESKYLVVRPEALIKLELMQNDPELRSLAFDRFTIMSGYRTPYYNARIGNDTSYSRHLYGDAMDIYVDGDSNDVMDDINGDGRIDRKDAIMLLRIAEKIDNSAQWSWLKGGAGIYNANSAHGPYLHIDTRGYVARWGL